MKAAQKVTVTQLAGTTQRTSDGDCDRIDRFAVQRESGDLHVVSVRRSWDTGTPQSERCDCQGFKFRGKCCHIDALYASGQLTVCWE